jgi:tight adherence protein C
VIGALLGAASVLVLAWHWRPPPQRVVTMVSIRRTTIPPVAVIVAVAVVAVALLGVPLGLAAAPAVVFVRRWRLRRAARRRDSLVQRHLPDVVELMASAVDAGCTLAVALPLLAPLAPEPFSAALEAVVRRQRQGERVADALGALSDQLGASVTPVVAALAGCERNGLPLGPTLARLAVEARHDRRRQAEAAARALPVRLSFPLVLCLLPAFVLLGIVPAMLPALQSLHLSGHPLPSSPPAVGSSP